MHPNKVYQNKMRPNLDSHVYKEPYNLQKVPQINLRIAEQGKHLVSY